MRNTEKEKMNNQRGSATIEAVVAFTGFLLVFFTILGVVNYSRAQMRISAAVDTAARELSQYAYFYDMSGMQKFDLAYKDVSQDSEKLINEVLSTVDSLYTTVGDAMDQSAEDGTNLANAVSHGELSVDQIKQTLSNIDENATNIEESINQVAGQIEAIGDNPILYMRSLVAIAGQEGMDLAKRAIASSLSELFVLKHFGDSYEERNANLKALGVVDGVDGLNFKMSSMFTDEHCQEIQVVVFYKVKLAQFFDWEILEVDLCKQAVCSAWLGGDEVVKLKTSKGSDGQASSDGGAEEAPADGSNGEG